MKPFGHGATEISMLEKKAFYVCLAVERGRNGNFNKCFKNNLIIVNIVTQV